MKVVFSTSIELSNVLWRSVVRAAVMATFAWSPIAHASHSTIYVTIDKDGVPTYTDRALGSRSRVLVRRAMPVPVNANACRSVLPKRRELAPRTASEDIGRIIRKASLTYAIDESLLHAVVRTESAYNVRAVSRAGAVGLMQLMPATATRYGVSDRTDARQNVDGGTRYLRYLIDLFKGDLSLALAAYNAGEGAVFRHGSRIPPYSETRSYVQRVLAMAECDMGG